MTPCEQMTIGMLSAYCVALRIIDTSPSLDEARRRMESVWRETRRVFDMEDERMSETRKMICDICGASVERKEFVVPQGWMHLSAWHRPDDAAAEYSGSADFDVCPGCIMADAALTDLAVECRTEYNNAVRRMDRWRPSDHCRPSSA